MSLTRSIQFVIFFVSPSAAHACGWLTHNLAVIPAKAGIQGVHGIARCARDLNSYLRFPHRGRVSFLCSRKKRNQKKARPGAAEYPLRFSPKSALA